MFACSPPLRFVLAVLSIAVSLPTARVTAQATQADVVRGRVIAADSTPLQNATVTAIDSVAQVPRQIRTDAKGGFSITFDNGSGTYMVAVTMLGYAPQRRTVARRADGTLPQVDFKMTPVAAQL